MSHLTKTYFDLTSPWKKGAIISNFLTPLYGCITLSLSKKNNKIDKKCTL